MEHVVFFPSPDGTPAFRRLGSLDDAARFVEHLRNVENVNEASVHSLTEVPLAFKAWYRVELPQSAEPAASSDTAESIAPPLAVGPEIDASEAGDAVVDDEPVEVADAVELPSHLEIPAHVEIPAQVEIPAPATIAEVIESYTNVGAGRQLELPEGPGSTNPTGSSTGIVVPDRQFATQEQYAFAPAGAAAGQQAAPAFAESAPDTSQRANVANASDGERREAQVLEPIFGARRDRGIGYFAR